MHLCVGYVLRSKTLTVEDGQHNANALWYNTIHNVMKAVLNNYLK